MKSLNIIGCGKAARVIARRWAEARFFSINGVLNRSRHSAEAAVSFIGSGRAISSPHEFEPAEFLLIGAADDALESVARSEAATNAVLRSGIAFHLSGALPSTVLEPLCTTKEAQIASLHPLRSFADPVIAYHEFPETDCALEGDERAVAALCEALEIIGAKTFIVDAVRKTQYHVGAVMLSNCLVALADAGTELLCEAGVSPDKALELACNMMRSTVSNIEQLGTQAALTGPIVRGDIETVRRQLAMLDEAHPESAAAYRSLGLRCIRLADAFDRHSERRVALRALLSERSST